MYRLVKGLIEAHHRLSDPTALARKRAGLEAGTQNCRHLESNPQSLLLNFFPRIFTRAPNYCQDLHERMFLELLLLPN